jgi:hypothetical protein
VAGSIVELGKGGAVGEFGSGEWSVRHSQLKELQGCDVAGLAVSSELLLALQRTDKPPRLDATRVFE